MIIPLAPSERRCGECTLCCKLIPVGEFNKPANKACHFQRSFKGCAVHGKGAQPFTCKVWSCGWLTNNFADDLARPDRSHYVIDPSPEFVEQVENATGNRRRIDVVQIWVDPKYPDAHRDPALRAWIDARGARLGHAALIRYDSRNGLHLFPPSITADRQWHELTGTNTGRQHTTAEILEPYR